MYQTTTPVIQMKTRGLSTWLVHSIRSDEYLADKQDADFDGELPTKKRKKNKKGKNKAVEPEVEEVEDENLTVADKAKKVKKAMEEYKALDHEDMVSHPFFLHNCD
jgi:hypothetical protein